MQDKCKIPYIDMCIRLFARRFQFFQRACNYLHAMGGAIMKRKKYSFLKEGDGNDVLYK